MTSVKAEAGQVCVEGGMEREEARVGRRRLKPLMKYSCCGGCERMNEGAGFAEGSREEGGY